MTTADPDEARGQGGGNRKITQAEHRRGHGALYDAFSRGYACRASATRRCANQRPVAPSR